MFFSRALLVVFKTTGGKAWNPPGGLRPLSKSQRRNRKKNIEQTLRNLSVLKMAEAHQPEVPTRLYKPLNHWRLLWMRKKLDQAKELLGWSSTRAQAQQDRLPPRNAKEAAAARVRQQAGEGVVPGLSVVDPAYVARVKALAMTLRAEKALASS